ncbi:MAG: sugar nucleotide-binding protein [Nitrospira sp.]|nr:sugar nucleotide-binding protein [Nitrospira sp.]
MQSDNSSAGPRLRIAVTGATGYIGTRLIRLAHKHHHHIIAISRRKPRSCDVDWIPWDMSSEMAVLPQGTDAVVHLAAQITQSTQTDNEQEIRSAKMLTTEAQRVGAKVIFVSSQTARQNAPTTYGRTKWHIEQHVLANDGWVVRPGLVYGASAKGLFGRLIDIVGRMPILPAFIPVPYVQPIHVDDLAEGLLRIIECRDSSRRIFSLAAPQPVPFTDVLLEIARSRIRRYRMFLPIPSRPFMNLVKILDAWRLHQWGTERLQSLFALQKMETRSDLDHLGLVLRPMSSGMHISGDAHTRNILQEGRALLAYVLRVPPERAVVCRYVRLIKQLRDGRAVGLPTMMLRYPTLLSLIGASAWHDETRKADFAWRMDAATLLGEATPTGSDRFLGLGRSCSLFTRIQTIVNAVACELMWRSLGVVMLPLVRKMLACDRSRP